jgi:NADH-quinone oxidoreductase subunit M
MNITEIHWTTQASFPILASLQFFPLLVMALLLMVNKHKEPLTLIIIPAIGAVIELALAVTLYQHYDMHNTAMQLAEQVTILQPLQYHVAVDGVSIMFILLTAFLSLMMVLYSHVIPVEHRRRLLALCQLVVFSLMSLYTTLDLLWFLLISVIQLIVLGYILWRWATSPERDLALSRYLQFMGIGLLLLLVGIMMLGWHYSDVTGHWSFDLLDLVKVPIDHPIQSIIFFLLFYGLAIRIPLFPLHGWLPIVAEHGMVTIAPVFLLGLKVGAYGLVRFVFPLVPDAVIHWHEFVMAFAVTGVFYAALLALMQVNLRRLLAFAVVSHSSIMVIGLFSLNHQAFQGSMMLAVNFGLAITGLLMISGFIYWRTRTMLISKLGGLIDTLPLFGVTFFIAGLSIIGMPGTPGFDSVHLVLEAAIHRFGALVTVAAALGNVLAAGFLLLAFQKAFMAPRQSSGVQKEINPASVPESFMALTLIILLLLVGFYSGPWLDLIEPSLEGLSNLYDHLDY